MDLPANGYFSDASRTNGEAKQAQDDMRDVISQLIGGSAESELTISSGSITIPTRDAGCHTVDTESDAASDNLDTIDYTNAPDGRMIMIRAEDGSRAVTVRHSQGGAGEIVLLDSANYALKTDRWLMLLRVGTQWLEVNRNAVVALASQSEAEAGTNNTKGMTPLRVKQAIDALTGSPTGHISGLVPSNNATDGDHDIDVSAGNCRDSSDAADLSLSSSVTVAIDAAYDVGTNGGLSSSLTLSADTWYHAFLTNDGKIGYDTDISASNLVTDHSITAYRYLYSVLTNGSSNIIAFKAREIWGGGLEVLWLDPPLDFTANMTVSGGPYNVGLSVPPDIGAEAIFNADAGVSSGRGDIYFWSDDVNDEVALFGGTPTPGLLGITSGAAGQFRVRTTNITGQAAIKADVGNTNLSDHSITTIGWVDARR